MYGTKSDQNLINHSQQDSKSATYSVLQTDI